VGRELGYRGVQIPTWDTRLFDLKPPPKANLRRRHPRASSQSTASASPNSPHISRSNLSPSIPPTTSPSTASPPRTSRQSEGPPGLAVEQLRCRQSSSNLGLTAHATFSGALAWPYLYPWPQRPAGPDRDRLRRASARGAPSSTSSTSRRRPLLRIHPGEDLHDGITFEMSSSA